MVANCNSINAELRIDTLLKLEKDHTYDRRLPKHGPPTGGIEGGGWASNHAVSRKRDKQHHITSPRPSLLWYTLHCWTLRRDLFQREETTVGHRSLLLGRTSHTDCALQQIPPLEAAMQPISQLCRPFPPSFPLPTHPIASSEVTGDKIRSWKGPFDDIPHCGPLWMDYSGSEHTKGQ